MASFEKDKITAIDSALPYASMSFECSNKPKILKGFITHKGDFEVLWAIFKERKINDDGEVLFSWSNKRYKNIFYSLLSNSMPKLWVMICKKSSFELHTDNNYRPQLTGQDRRWLASQPIEDVKPDVMR